MHPDRWAQIEATCAAALDREPALRAAYLDQACLADPELRMEVESLIAALAKQPSFLEEPLLDLSAFDSLPPSEDLRLPESIGPYRLLSRLGRGGMGEVFLAERETEDLKQRVALKVIRRGLDTEEVLRRFRLERRILAGLHHPNIAALLDAAVAEDGRPYFVMEFVEGMPLDQYCDRQRWSIRERLQLFQIVCRAVQHAHQNLVVHRDLKPGNIFVTEEGVPKLLDFGIGKVLAPTELFGPAVETSTDLRLLTPEYAAPEQIRGDLVTTAADVYSLGVILYELLTSSHPFSSARTSRRELELAVLSSDPERPSALVGRVRPTRAGLDASRLRHLLTGDLDTIVLTALKKEPGRRYPSASALAADIQRHLDGLPVTARPDTFGYRAGKFLRRHTAAVAVTLVGVVGLAGVTAVTLVQSARVRLESARVLRERDKALEVRDFLMELFGASGADRSVGDTVTVRRLLDLQRAQLGRASAMLPDTRAEMLEVLADGYDRLGLVAPADSLAEAALALRKAGAGGSLELASSLSLNGWIRHELGKSREAEPLLLQAARLRREAGSRGRAELSLSLNDLGVVYNALGRYREADSVLTESLAIRRQVFGDDHHAVGITANNLAASLYFQGRLDSAVAVQHLAVGSLQSSVGADHQRTVVALGNLAAFKQARGDWAAAESDYRELLERQTRLQGADHPVTARVRNSLASVLFEQAVASGSDSGLVQAELLYRQALAAFETRLGGAHPQIGTTLDRLSAVLIEQGRLPEALSSQERAVRILVTAYGDSNLAVLSARGRLALIQSRLRQHTEAERIGRGVLDMLERTAGATQPVTGRAHAMLCEILLAAGQRASEARDHCRQADRILSKASAPQRGNFALLQLQLARSELVLGNTRVADSLVRAVQTGSGGHLSGRVASLADSLTAILAQR